MSSTLHRSVTSTPDQAPPLALSSCMSFRGFLVTRDSLFLPSGVSYHDSSDACDTKEIKLN